VYHTAILETDDSQLYVKINAAEAAIQKRFQSNEPDDDEAVALGDAMHSLSVLCKERLSM
jgi:hypothetical protein